MRKFLGTQVQILKRGMKSKIEIEFYSKDDLDRIVEIIMGFPP